MSTVHVQQCPLCRSEYVFEQVPVSLNPNQPDIRELIAEWPEDINESDHFDPQRIAYKQRLRESASTLVANGEPYPPSAFVCSYCVNRGALNETLNDITIQNLQQLAAFNEFTKRQTSTGETSSTDTVTEHEMMEMEAIIAREMRLAEMLDEEYVAVEAQLKAQVEVHRSNANLVVSAHNALRMAEDTLKSLEIQLAEVEMSLSRLPKTAYQRWDHFFDIRDETMFASLRGVPVAYQGLESKQENPSPPFTGTTQSVLGIGSLGAQSWGAATLDVQCINAGLTFLSALIGRLTANSQSIQPELFRDRKYRVLTSPPAIDSRFPSKKSPKKSAPNKSYSLLPFIPGSGSGSMSGSGSSMVPNEKWPKALHALSSSINLLFTFWQCTPPYPLPSHMDKAYYQLDLSKPHQWNEKMRHLILNAKALIALRFPPPKPSEEPTTWTSERVTPRPQI